MQSFISFFLLIAIALFCQCDGRKIFVDDDTHTYYPRGFSSALAKSNKIDKKFSYWATDKRFLAEQLIIHATKKETKRPDEKIRMAQRGIIRNFKQIDEIIVSGVVPDRYFLNLEAVPSTKTVKHLTLYKYKGTMLRKPCEIFPNLESLLIEQTDMSGIKYLWDLSACNVKRLTVRAVPVFTPVPAAAGLTGVNALWDLLDQFTDAETIKSQEESAFDQIDRQSFYERKKDSKAFAESDLMKYSVIEGTLKNSLEYIEVSPVTDAFFVNVINNVDRTFTTARLNFGSYELAGTLNRPYFYIYDMTIPPPTAALSAAIPLLITDTELGLKFDENALSTEWRTFLTGFTALTKLKADCPVEILINIEVVLAAALPALRTLTVTVAEKDMDAAKEAVIVANSQKFVDALTNKVLKIRAITDLAPFTVASCTNSIKPKQGLKTVVYTCPTN